MTTTRLATLKLEDLEWRLYFWWVQVLSIQKYKIHCYVVSLLLYHSLVSCGVWGTRELAFPDPESTRGSRRQSQSLSTSVPRSSLVTWKTWHRLAGLVLVSWEVGQYGRCDRILWPWPAGPLIPCGDNDVVLVGQGVSMRPPVSRLQGSTAGVVVLASEP